MVVQLESERGRIIVTDEAIAKIAGAATLECYGLVGMASKNKLKDGIAELLRLENLGRGVDVHHEGDTLQVDLYVVVSYGTRISEVAHNIQSVVKYVLNEIVGLHVSAVNIIVQGVRVS
jgi:uncharacterized alkaline shock family protein YloU